MKKNGTISCIKFYFDVKSNLGCFNIHIYKVLRKMKQRSEYDESFKINVQEIVCV